MLRTSLDPCARLVQMFALAGCVLGSSCATQGDEADSAPAAEQMVVDYSDTASQTGAPAADDRMDDDTPVGSRSLQEQFAIVWKLRFDVELLQENVRQVSMFRERRFVSDGRLSTLIREQLARLRADAARLAPSITDPRHARTLKFWVLDPLDELAKSPVAGAAGARVAPTVASIALDLNEQRHLLDRFVFETEMMKEDVRDYEEWLEVGRSHDLCGLVPTGHERLPCVTYDARQAAARISDLELQRQMRTEVLDVLAELAKVPCIAAFRQEQRDDLEQLKFDVELLKEDIRQVPEIEAELRLLGSGPRRVSISEKLSILYESADRLASRIADPRLTAELRGVVNVLDECAKSPYAKR